jgi:hypothetical protein
MLILADYGADANTTITSNLYPHLDSGTPAFASDNFYADVTGDDLPDVIFSRITANTAAQLKVMCSKFLNYERNPPTDPSFYDKPIVAEGWQDDRWFQLGAEIFGGYLKSIGKHQVRINDLGSPAANSGNNVTNTGTWSTASNTTAVVNYFGPTGLNYIPAKPGTLGGFVGGNSTAIKNAINSGAFMLLHRDHGFYAGWGEPGYSTSNIGSLTNVNNKLPFIFTINCQTGAYHRTSECFAEKFHRYTYTGQNSGALGLIAPTEVSYSFVNDIFIWGIFDNMWPNFMPAYGSTPASRDMRPAFANAAGKYFLKQSSWNNSSSQKQITYRLFHMHGDAFQWFYSEVPQALTVSHNSMYNTSTNAFTVTANAGSFISLTTVTPTGIIILGTATGTGAPVSIPLSTAVSGTSKILVTVTKQNYLRYSKLVGITASVEEDAANNFNFNIYPNPFSQSTTLSYLLNEPCNITISVYNLLGEEVAIVVDNVKHLSGTYEVQFNNNNLPAGVYSCVLKTDNNIITKKIVINN